MFKNSFKGNQESHRIYYMLRQIEEHVEDFERKYLKLHPLIYLKFMDLVFSLIPKFSYRNLFQCTDSFM